MVILQLALIVTGVLSFHLGHGQGGHTPDDVGLKATWVRQAAALKGPCDLRHRVGVEGQLDGCCGTCSQDDGLFVLVVSKGGCN